MKSDQYMMTVKELRKKTGMSQQKFGDYFGISKRTIQEWEQERKNPTDYLVNMMQRILDNEYFK